MLITLKGRQRCFHVARECGTDLVLHVTGELRASCCFLGVAVKKLTHKLSSVGNLARLDKEAG